MESTTIKTDNGVDVAALLAARDALTEAPEAAQFRWRATCTWMNGTHSRSSVEEYFGLGEDQRHKTEFSFDADHPELFAAEDNGATPVEYVLVGLASCLTSGIGNIASARGVKLYEVESRIEGDIDIQGILGLSDEVRNGYQSIRVDFTIKGDAPEEKLREIVEQSRSRSAVFDIVSNGVPVEITVNQNDD